MAPPGSSMSSSHRSAGRSNTTTNPASSTSSKSPIKLSLSTKNLRPKASLNRDEHSSGGYSASPMSPDTTIHPPRTSSRQKIRDNVSNPNSVTPSVKTSSTGNHAKLHKRGTSASSLPGPPSPFAGMHSQFSTPFATYEEPFPDVGAASTSGSGVPKIKPYLRKMSIAKEDQGMIDLSKSTTENDRLAGLGIQDFGAKSASDVSFAHMRRGHHGRNTSGGSQISTASAKPFIHPMAKTPRPYTPPGRSYASSINDEEANESDDIVDDDFRLGNGFRTRRSMSISSVPALMPTPLSQSHTADELGLVPKLTSTSQSNLSTTSDKSSRSRQTRPRGNTDLSQELALSPSSRTSLDKAFSFVSKRNISDPEPQTRDEKIREARRKFEEKEANKDRKIERKRRDSEAKQRSRQNSSVLPGSPLKPALKQVDITKKQRRMSAAATAGAQAVDEKRSGKAGDLQAMSYEEHRPANTASLPRYGDAPGESEKTSRYAYESRPVGQGKAAGVGMRFSTWLQTRMLSCGGKE
ncbi:uncharacterized protein CLAFUR5_11894 [Fulvia fulva]|uniref:Uncharacterized protein n=1 Tax=Passalora fulva TaxID=5499 RepID=A0A9Q8PIJ7_PASFU|nr:uncharacterized protein CLAFUR5_11894 [Fulvia fulva]KAK4628268.1 hypothetical protein CLAFUR0_05003 [Fulvia fulva]UJO23088.1 hypothetical protein CLAFUR5_11894 [Fulvia fulva]